jgi:hypothetical protein
MVDMLTQTVQVTGRLLPNLVKEGLPTTRPELTGYNCAHRWRLPRAPNSGRTRSYRQ